MKATKMKKYKCPCCKNDTLTEKSPGTFEICPICDWEDDDVQFFDPEYEGGANGISLKAAIKQLKYTTPGKEKKQLE